MLKRNPLLTKTKDYKNKILRYQNIFSYVLVVYLFLNYSVIKMQLEILFNATEKPILMQWCKKPTKQTNKQKNPLHLLASKDLLWVQASPLRDSIKVTHPLEPQLFHQLRYLKTCHILHRAGMIISYYFAGRLFCNLVFPFRPFLYTLGV